METNLLTIHCSYGYLTASSSSSPRRRLRRFCCLSVFQSILSLACSLAALFLLLLLPAMYKGYKCDAAAVTLIGD